MRREFKKFAEDEIKFSWCTAKMVSALLQAVALKFCEAKNKFWETVEGIPRLLIVVHSIAKLLFILLVFNLL